jgi:hypothetical protein
MIANGHISYGYKMDNTISTARDFLYYSGDMFAAEITVSAWINPSFLATGNESTTHPHTIARLYRSGSGNYPDVRLVIRNGVLEGSYFSASPSESTTITSTLTIPANDWTFVAITLSPTALTVYKNGEAPQSVAISGTLSTRLINRVLLGLRFNSDSEAQGFTGIMDEVRLYRRALEATDISELFVRESNPITGALWAQWHLNGNLQNAVPNPVPALSNIGGTLVNGRGRILQCQSFVNTDSLTRQFIYLPWEQGLDGQVTATAWVNPSLMATGDVTTTHPHTILHFYRSGGTITPRLRLMLSNGMLAARYLNNAAGVTVPDDVLLTSTLAIPADKWTFVGITLTSNSLTIFKNDEAPTSKTVNGRPYLTMNRLLYGLNLNDAVQPQGLTGRLDELSIYRNPLTREEILSIYASESSASPSSARNWNLY